MPPGTGDGDSSQGGRPQSLSYLRPSCLLDQAAILANILFQTMIIVIDEVPPRMAGNTSPRGKQSSTPARFGGDRANLTPPMAIKRAVQSDHRPFKRGYGMGYGVKTYMPLHFGKSTSKHAVITSIIAQTAEQFGIFPAHAQFHRIVKIGRAHV